MANANPTGPDKSSSKSSDAYTQAINDDKNYVKQFQVTAQTTKFWESLFHTELTPQEVQRMTDGFVQGVCDQMNHTMNWALQQQKQRDAQQQKEQQGQS